MSASDIRQRTQETWDRFYRLSQIWQRASCVRSLRSRLAFVLVSKLYRQMYANTGIARPMPDLEAPRRTSVPVAP